MRIRKPHRNTSLRVVPVDENVRNQAIDVAKPVVDGDGRATPSSTPTPTPELPASAEMASLLMLSRQAAARFPADQFWEVPDGEHATRHYVRRTSNAARKEGSEQDEMPSGEMEFGMQPPPVDSSQGKAQTEMNSVDHPAIGSEGSLVHTLYLQLLAAGGEGITLRDLFTSFKKQTALPRFGYDWKEQVRSQLKSNPHFDEVKGHFLLRAQSRRNIPTASDSLKRPYMGVNPRTTSSSGRNVRSTVQTTHSIPAAVQLSDPPVEKNYEGVQTRRKAYEKSVEAVLTESAREFRLLQQSASESPSPRAPAPTLTSASPNVEAADATDSRPTPATSRKRKYSSENEQQDGSRTIRGSLQALQAKIVAETGEQNGVPCSRKDDARKWRCPLMAMEGHSLCEHHRALQLRKRVKRQEEPTSTRTRTGLQYSPRVKPPAGRLIQRRLKSGSEAGISPEKEENLGGDDGDGVEGLVDTPAQQQAPDSSDAEDHTHEVEEESEPEALVKQDPQTEDSPSKSVADCEPDHEPDLPITSAQYKKAIPGSLKALQAKLVESGIQEGVRCARRDGSNDSARKWQCPLNAMEGHTLCEHHTLLKERKRARYAATKQTGKFGARRRKSRASKNLPVSPAASPASLTRQASKASERSEKSEKEEAPVHPSTSSEPDTRSHDANTEAAELVNTDDNQNAELAAANAKEEDSNAELVLPRSAPKRGYVAAKKTAAGVDAVKEKTQPRETSPLIRSPTIPPLPAMYGVRRKVVKNRSLLSL